MNPKRFLIAAALMVIIFSAPALIAAAVQEGSEVAGINLDPDTIAEVLKAILAALGGAALIETASTVFFVGVGGLTVTALTAVLKRFFKAEGIGTILISVAVSAALTAVYYIPFGFEILKFLIVSGVVSLAANGIYLFPQKRKP